MDVIFFETQSFFFNTSLHEENSYENSFELERNDVVYDKNS